MAITSVNPATGENLRSFSPHNDQDVEQRLECAERAFEQHRRQPILIRASLMIAAASILEREKQDLARIITLEMGKLFSAAIEEVEKCARGCRFYAENAERFLEDETAQTSAARTFVRYEPLGTILAIMPWNFPFWQVFRFAAPAIMAGEGGGFKKAAHLPPSAPPLVKVFFRGGGGWGGVFSPF